MPDQINNEETIFKAAAKLNTPAERLAYVKSACADNSTLLARITALLEVHNNKNELLDVLIPDPDITPDDSPISEIPGTVIDRYKLLEKIGEGGMAVVYMAEQTEPIRRKVALKIIKLGMDTRSVIARFEAERQALAMMDHPNIAKVLDAGATETGRPYFVMELVTGVSITDYCDANNLSTKERLKLFIEVCNAVQHAHQKGIIHRDIKPSNVMVTHHDGKPVPKVIDFGIAKAINQKLTEKTLFTRYAHIIGTPAYMSPEQAELSGLDIDTRSDIYSLGVLLYELLTSKTPFDEKELMRSGIDEMRKIIREQDPPKPSTKFATFAIEEQSTTATRHSTDSSRLISLLRGDLDWIVMKCLEKDRKHRYETANGLALDVTRYLKNEPVIARPPTVVYKLQKAWRRNKVICTAVSAVILVLLAGLGISMWEGMLARRSEVNALRRAYNSDMSLAFRALEENLFGSVQDIVNQHFPKPGEPDFRGWEWRYAWAQSRSEAVHTWDTPEEMGEIYFVRISPDERYLVSSEFHPGPVSGEVKIRRLWNFQTKEELKHVHLPSGQPRGFVFSNSGNHLALHSWSGKGAHEIHIYDTTTWELETVLPSETEIRFLSFSPDDKTLATIGPLAAILWDWRQRTIIHEWPVHGRWAPLDVAFFPNGRRLAIGGADELKIVDVTTGSIEHRQSAPDDGTILAISPDSRYVAIGSGYKISNIGLLDTASPDPNLWEQEPPLIGHSRWVTSLVFSADGRQLISSSSDHTIRIWDMNRRVTERVLRGHQSEVRSVSLTHEKTRIVSSGVDKRILEWDLNAPTSPFCERVLTERVKQVVFSADSLCFYTIDDESVSIWDAKTFSKQHLLSGEFGPDSSIILSPDGCYLVTGTGSGQLWILDAKDLQVIAHRKVLSEQILPVGFSSDGKSLVALESGNKISLWNTDNWQLRSRVETTLKIEFYIKNYCEIPPDSDLLLCPSGGDLVWWDLKQSSELATLRVNSLRSGVIAVSPTESLLASASGYFISLWDWQTRQPVSRRRRPGDFNSVAFSPDGRRLVTGSIGKGALMLWDVSTTQEIARFGPHLSPIITSVQFSPDGNMICAVGKEETAYFFRAPSFEEINSLEAESNRKEMMP